MRPRPAFAKIGSDLGSKMVHTAAHERLARSTKSGWFERRTLGVDVSDSCLLTFSRHLDAIFPRIGLDQRCTLVAPNRPT